MEEEVSFHAYFGVACSRTEVWRAVKKHAAHLGLPVSDEPVHNRLFLGPQEDRSPRCAIEFAEANSQVMITALTPAVFETRGPEAIRGFLTGLSSELGVLLGRTSKEGGLTSVRTAELTGELQYLDWYQFFGHEVASRWGVERLARGPFDWVQSLADGACAFTTAREPFGDLSRIRECAGYLDITLRPVVTRDSKGRVSRIEW